MTTLTTSDTKHGFLVREGDALERLAKVTKICFDKTGTLTYGTPKVTAVKSVSDMTDNEVYAYTAAAEQFSEHPLGKAVVKCYKVENRNIPNADNFKMLTGRGVSATTDGKQILSGNKKLLDENNITLTDEIKSETKKYISEGCTVIYTAIDSKLKGYIVLADTVREESKNMLSEIRSLGVEPVLLTGDNKNALKQFQQSLEFRKSNLTVCRRIS